MFQGFLIIIQQLRVFQTISSTPTDEILKFHYENMSKQTAILSKHSKRLRHDITVYTCELFSSKFRAQLKENVWVKKTLARSSSNIFNFILEVIV